MNVNIVYNWLVVWNLFLFFHTLGIGIPTDYYLFRGVETTNQINIPFVCEVQFHPLFIFSLAVCKNGPISSNAQPTSARGFGVLKIGGKELP